MQTLTSHKFAESTMKIGKYKGLTYREIAQEEDGKRYLCWFVDNVINEENEKFYGKLVAFVHCMRDNFPDCDKPTKKVFKAKPESAEKLIEVK